MREASVDSVVLSKSIDNSGVVREVDPRTSRDLLALLLLVGILVGGLVLYAWPHFQMRQTAIATEQMQRERERLVEENRKLRLEKASLENLARVQAIAERHLGLTHARRRPSRRGGGAHRPYRRARRPGQRHGPGREARN